MREAKKSTSEFIKELLDDSCMLPDVESDMTVDIPDVAVPLPTFTALCRIKGVMEVVAHVVRNAESLDVYDDLARQASDYAVPGDEPIKETALETVLKMILDTPALRLSDAYKVVWRKEDTDA